MCPVLLESINLAWTFHWKCKKTSKILVSDSIWVLIDMNFFKFLLYQIRFNCQTVKPWTFSFETFFLDITRNFTVAFVIILLRSSFHALVVSCKCFLLLSKISVLKLNVEYQTSNVFGKLSNFHSKLFSFRNLQWSKFF